MVKWLVLFVALTLQVLYSQPKSMLGYEMVFSIDPFDLGKNSGIVGGAAVWQVGSVLCLGPSLEFGTSDGDTLGFGSLGADVIVWLNRSFFFAFEPAYGFAEIEGRKKGFPVFGFGLGFLVEKQWFKLRVMPVGSRAYINLGSGVYF